jgi:hypothetical protein
LFPGYLKEKQPETFSSIDTFLSAERSFRDTTINKDDRKPAAVVAKKSPPASDADKGRGNAKDRYLELRFLCISAVVARLLAMPSPQTIPKVTDSPFNGSKRYPLKLKFGEDEVLFLLNKDDDLRTYLNGLEKRPLDTPSFVEVRRSPIHGLGVFTTKDCLPGDLLFSERPMVSMISSCIVEQINTYNYRLY